MDRRLAEALIAPLREGSPIAGLWKLMRIELSEDRRAIQYIVGRENLCIRLTPRDDAQGHFCQTKNFNVTIASDRPLQLAPAEQTIVEHLSRLLQHNDTREREERSWWTARGVEPPSKNPSRTRSRLYLVPGHIGNPRDITLRALDLLDRVHTLFVEVGKELDARTNLDLWGIDHGGKHLVSVGNGENERLRLAAELDRVVEAGEDACLFGVDEGLPGFLDPGAILLDLAEERRHRLDVRTVGGGGVLGPALMRVMPQAADHAFSFLGHLELHTRDRVLQRITWTVERDRAAGEAGWHVLFSAGEPLRACWSALLDALSDHRGDLCIFSNLTLDDERVFRLSVRERERFDPATLRTEDKIVLWLVPARPSENHRQDGNPA